MVEKLLYFLSLATVAALDRIKNHSELNDIQCLNQVEQDQRIKQVEVVEQEVRVR